MASPETVWTPFPSEHAVAYNTDLTYLVTVYVGKAPLWPAKRIWLSLILPGEKPKRIFYPSLDEALDDAEIHIRHLMHI